MQKKILNDHKKVGKQLIPPLSQMGTFREVSYTRTILPECIWLAILNKSFGVRKGTEIGLEVVKLTSKIIDDSQLYSFISSYESLTADVKSRIKKNLSLMKLLIPLREALHNFVSLFPETPLSFLFDDIPRSPFDVEEIKQILTVLYDKRSPETTFMLTAVVYHQFGLDRLKVTNTSSLARFPEIQDYPHSEISIGIASAVRATMNTLMQPPFFNVDSSWNSYFWNRCIQLEPPKL